MSKISSSSSKTVKGKGHCFCPACGQVFDDATGGVRFECHKCGEAVRKRGKSTWFDVFDGRWPRALVEADVNLVLECQGCPPNIRGRRLPTYLNMSSEHTSALLFVPYRPPPSRP